VSAPVNIVGGSSGFTRGRRFHHAASDASGSRSLLLGELKLTLPEQPPPKIMVSAPIAEAAE